MQSAAQKRAKEKYNKNNYDMVLLRLPKNTKTSLQNLLFSERDNISLNSYVIGLILYTIVHILNTNSY